MAILRNRAILIVLVFLSALFVVLATHQKRQLVAELKDVRQQAEQLQFEHDKLGLERGAWGAHSRIEKVARNQFKMRPPKDSEVVVLDLSEPVVEQLVLGGLAAGEMQ